MPVTMPSRMLDLPVFYEQDESGGYVAVCPAIPGCYSQGDDLPSAEANIRECILMCLEELEELGEPMPGLHPSFVGHVAVPV
jgi:predicted RNase H-like HicB family nuclease